MADHFVDYVNGSNGNTGHDLDNAWATVEYAAESGTLVGGDYVWVRRNGTEQPATDIDDDYYADIDNPIIFAGCPRASLAVTSATWTNGSTTVDLILPATMSDSTVLGRLITGPDGNDYMITDVTDTNTIIIDREYVGTTVTLTNGAATIKADDYYTEFNAYDDSGDTIKKSDWNSDSDNIPVIDFQDAGYKMDWTNATARVWANFHIKDSSTQLLYVRATASLTMKNCIISQTASNQWLVYGFDGHYCHFERCIFYGNSLSAQLLTLTQTRFIFTRCHFQGLVRVANVRTDAKFDNCNFGVEVALSGAAFSFEKEGGNVTCCDCKFGGSVFNHSTSNAVVSSVSSEDHDNVLGAHEVHTRQGTVIRATAGAGGDVANKRSGGSDYLIEVAYDQSNGYIENPYSEKFLKPVFVHEFFADTTSRSYRYYVQSMMVLTASQLYIKARYLSAYDDTSEYFYSEVVSDETFTARADADDWAEYMEVTGIEPAESSLVRITCYANYYHATNNIYIDPKVVIA